MVFEGLSFDLDTRWRTGLTGRNGRGKTTLLRLLAGELEYRGSILADVTFDRFPYEAPSPGHSAMDALPERYGFEPWRLEREASLLGLDVQTLSRPFQTLSPGEQIKALLAALFCRDSRFPLIDEPTNHLDMQARQTVARYLAKKQGFLLVSHDRAFLDRCTDHIAAIQKTGVRVQKGNYSSYLENKRRQDEFEAAEHQKLEREIGRLGQAAGRTAVWSGRAEKAKYGQQKSGLSPDRGYVGHKAAKVMKRAKQMEERSQRALEQKRSLLRDLETAEPLKLAQIEYPGKTMMELRHVSVRYGSVPAVQDVSLKVEHGDRLALRGGNGAGKSTLIRLMMGMPLETEGEVFIGRQLAVSYVPQDLSSLHGGVREYARAAGADESLYLAILRKLDFSRSLFDRDLSELSAGQRKKAAIARSLCEKAHLHLWDEPLNFIDIDSRLQIESLILECRPTMVFVEHDEEFCSKVATREVLL